MSQFSIPVVVTVNKVDQTVNLSIRVTDTKVEVHTFTIAEFDLMIAQYQAQKKDTSQ